MPSANSLLYKGKDCFTLAAMKSLLAYTERGLTTQKNAERLECQCAWSPFDALGPECAAAPGL